MKKLLLLLLVFPLYLIAQTQINEDIVGLPNDILGAAVDITDDGNTIVIGAPSSNSSFGRVRVFENQNDAWVQVGEDIVGEFNGDRFGNEVSISANGSVIAASSPFNDEFANNAGHVRLFENINGAWIQIGDDIDGEEQNDLSGNAISLSADGDIIAIGARSNDGPNDSSSTTGHVRVFENQNGVWTQIGQDIDGIVVLLNNNNTNQFGDAVSLSDDGSILAVGAPANNAGGENAGRVRIFENQNGTWTPLGNEIIGNALDELGDGVSLSADGSIVAIGAPLSDENGQNSGTVRIFELQNDTWEQIGQNINGASSDDELGSRINLSADGSIVAIGLPSSNSSTGQTLIYQNDNGSWAQIGAPIEGGQAGDFSGAALSIARDQNIITISDLFNEDGGANAGRVRVFDFSDELLSTATFNTIDFNVIVNNEDNFIQVLLPSSTSQSLRQINLYGINGQLLLSSEEDTIGIESLPPGAYIIQMQTSAGDFARKIIIG